MNIAQNLKEITSELPDSVTLVAVSKTKPESDILEAYESGHRDFGENKVQELVAKKDKLPGDIRWHMIGHLQRNKVKYIADFVSLIHGVDSLRLLKEINKRAGQAERVVDCLLQMHIAEESTKFGLDSDELQEILEDDPKEQFPHVRIRGLMGMATFTDDQKQVKREFEMLKSLFDQYRPGRVDFDILSMGMSGDYEIAIATGSTMVRIGSSIFGARNT
ncbi:hypothetical protein SAMN04490243_1675 [Robiginitalea myxolifaciens]|uniref:Pyridoxal phosphate homeostasis protein n=1 Tax=Robiginitalea myxolifaciens TaxID=400055 RepID=A0A1I6GSX5_9FLAO|nr:YggS family pyridoxal phosphate-dependent enzyme [Robiginitalea myxolifaciens]SFR45181.1 hypothetical protein SAMN04490243_1675 [Robiginitalea myxolifaciens]